MPVYKTEAINIRCTRFGEADKLMTFFTKSCGKTGAIAKSAFKVGSKFGGRLELFGYNNLLLAKGKNLDILSQIETIENFHTISKNEPSLQAGMYMSKMLYYFLEERVKNEPLFELMIDCLRMLKSGLPAGIVTRFFDVRFADIEGFLPIEDFPGDIKQQVNCLKEGSIADYNLSQADLRGIDTVLIPRLCEHVGKDVSLWKNQ